MVKSFLQKKDIKSSLALIFTKASTSEMSHTKPKQKQTSLTLPFSSLYFKVEMSPCNRLALFLPSLQIHLFISNQIIRELAMQLEDISADLFPCSFSSKHAVYIR